MTDSSGMICYDADFYPFGGERTPYVNNCDPDYKFTGKERDSESGLDDFGARYFSSQYGRFMTPDPINHPSLSSWSQGTFLATPQRWNAYSYVLNNPLNGTDPTGSEMPVWEGQARTPSESASDVMLVTGLAYGGVAGEAGLLGRAAAYGRGLINAAIGYFLTPQGQQTAQDLINGLTPGQNLTLGRAGAIGVSSIEKLGENGFVGTLANGAQISAGFERAGDSLGVNISNIQSAAEGSVNFRALESGAANLAKAEGASSVTIQATNVTNSKLAQVLSKAGYAANQVTDKFGRTTVNYVKTIATCASGNRNQCN
jgi:RHS repeat-associated protein